MRDAWWSAEMPGSRRADGSYQGNSQDAGPHARLERGKGARGRRLQRGGDLGGHRRRRDKSERHGGQVVRSCAGPALWPGRPRPGPGLRCLFSARRRGGSRRRDSGLDLIAQPASRGKPSRGPQAAGRLSVDLAPARGLVSRATGSAPRPPGPSLAAGTAGDPAPGASAARRGYSSGVWLCRSLPASIFLNTFSLMGVTSAARTATMMTQAHQGMLPKKFATISPPVRALCSPSVPVAAALPRPAARIVSRGRATCSPSLPSPR